MTREWRKSIEENKINERIKVGYKKDNLLQIDCRAFADDVVSLKKIQQLKLLKELAEKTGLQISI